MCFSFVSPASRSVTNVPPCSRGSCRKSGRFLNVRFSLGATHIVHRASRYKVYDGTTTSVRHSQLGWLHAASPTFFRRSALHKDGSGRARSGSSEVVHSSSVSIRTHLPDAHVTRWPSGRARSRPPTAPLIRKGRAAERTRVLPQEQICSNLIKNLPARAARTNFGKICMYNAAFARSVKISAKSACPR